MDAISSRRTSRKRERSITTKIDNDDGSKKKRHDIDISRMKNWDKIEWRIDIVKKWEKNNNKA